MSQITIPYLIPEGNSILPGVAILDIKEKLLRYCMRKNNSRDTHYYEFIFSLEVKFQHPNIIFTAIPPGYYSVDIINYDEKSKVSEDLLAELDRIQQTTYSKPMSNSFFMLYYGSEVLGTIKPISFGEYSIEDMQQDFAFAAKHFYIYKYYKDQGISLTSTPHNLWYHDFLDKRCHKVLVDDEKIKQNDFIEWFLIQIEKFHRNAEPIARSRSNSRIKIPFSPRRTAPESLEVNCPSPEMLGQAKMVIYELQTKFKDIPRGNDYHFELDLRQIITSYIYDYENFPQNSCWHQPITLSEVFAI